MPPKRKSDDIEGPVPLSHVTGSINGYGVASNEESLPDFIGIDCVAVQPLPYHGTPPYGPAWKQKYMIRSNKTQRYLAAQIVDTNERNSLIDVILTEIGDWNPRILPIDVCLCVPQTGKQAVVSKYCNAGTIWHLYQESRRQRKLPPKAFTCHIFLQMLEALLSLSKRSVRHNACSLDNWFLEFPCTGLKRFPDVMLGS